MNFSDNQFDGYFLLGDEKIYIRWANSYDSQFKMSNGYVFYRKVSYYNEQGKCLGGGKVVEIIRSSSTFPAEDAKKAFLQE